MTGEYRIEPEDEARIMGEPGGEVRTYLWYVWAELTVENEALALHARRANPSALDRQFTEVEMKGSLTCIAAAAHSLDALQLDLLELGCVTTETLTGWKKRRPRQWSQVLQTLAVTFSDRNFGPGLQRDLQWLYGLRNDAVHNKAEWGSIGIHPSLGVLTTPARVRYSVENASRASSIVLNVLTTATRAGQLADGRVTDWSGLWRPGVEEIVTRRGMPPFWSRFGAN